MKHTTFTQGFRALLVSSAFAALAACGSGGGGGTAPVSNVSTSEVPQAATQQTSAAMAFVKSVVDKGEANQDTPLVVGEAMLASSDTDEPVSGL